MSTAAERIAAREGSRGRTAADRIAKRASSGGKTASDRVASRYQHPTGGARGETFLEQQAPKVRPTGVWTPVQAVFDWVSRPAYAVGNLAAGRPLESLKNTINFVMPVSAGIPGLAGEREFVSNVLRRRNLLPGGIGGSILGFGVDVLTDPLTYVTVGAGAAATSGVRQAARAGTRQIVEAGRERAAAGASRRATPQEIAQAYAPEARARLEAPTEFRIGVSFPFTRRREVPVFTSERLPRAVKKLDRFVPSRIDEAATATRGVVSPSGKASRPVADLFRQIQANSEVWRRDFDRLAATLDDTARQLDKQIRRSGNKDWKIGDSAKAITLHVAKPQKYDLPDEMAGPLAEQAVKAFNDLLEMERKAGIDVGFRENYVPFLLAKEKDRPVLERVYGLEGAAGANRLDNPFFVNRRLADDIDVFMELGAKHGFEPELNIAKLIQRRAAASFKAQEKKAFDDAIAGQWAGKPPPEPMPDVAGARAALEKEEARLRQLEQRKPTRQLQVVAGERRGQVADARAALRAAETAVERTSKAVGRQRQRLKAAQKRKVPERIKEARAALRRAQAAERRAHVALNVARKQYEGTPTAVRAQTREVARAKKRLSETERKAGIIAAGNARLAERPGTFFPSREEYEAAKETWEQLGSATKYHDGDLLPPEIARDMREIHDRINKTVRDEDGLAAIGRFMANLGGRWKALALFSPGYHIRNQLDDGFRALAVGAQNPRTYGQAARIIPTPHPIARGRKDAPRAAWDETFKLGKHGEMTGKEIFDLAESLAVTRSGMVRADIMSTAEGVSRQRGLANLGRGPWVKGSAELGQYREDVMRLFTFMDLMKRGDDPVEAARKTTEALFDYGHVGRFVEMARRFWIPFITYPSKAIPWTARTMATRPGLLANVHKAIHASNMAAGNPDLSMLPSYMESGFAVPFPNRVKDALNIPRDQPVILNPERVTAWATANLLDPRPKEAFANIAGGMLNPMAVLPMKLAGLDPFFVGEKSPTTRQGPLEQFLERTTGIIPNVPEKKDAITGKTSPAMPTWIKDIAGLIPMHGQATYALPNPESDMPYVGIAKYLTGLPLSPLDRARQQALIERYGR